MEHFLSIQDQISIWYGIIIETLIIGTLTQFLLNKSTEKGQKHLEQTIQKLEDKIQRIQNMNQQQMKSLETWAFSIKEELKDEMRGLLNSRGGNTS